MVLIYHNIESATGKYNILYGCVYGILVYLYFVISIYFMV